MGEATLMKLWIKSYRIIFRSTQREHASRVRVPSLEGRRGRDEAAHRAPWVLGGGGAAARRCGAEAVVVHAASLSADLYYSAPCIGH